MKLRVYPLKANDIDFMEYELKDDDYIKPTGSGWIVIEGSLEFFLKDGNLLIINSASVYKMLIMY